MIVIYFGGYISTEIQKLKISYHQVTAKYEIQNVRYGYYTKADACISEKDLCSGNIQPMIVIL